MSYIWALEFRMPSQFTMLVNPSNCILITQVEHTHLIMSSWRPPTSKARPPNKDYLKSNFQKSQHNALISPWSTYMSKFDPIGLVEVPHKKGPWSSPTGWAVVGLGQEVLLRGASSKLRKIAQSPQKIRKHKATFVSSHNGQYSAIVMVTLPDTCLFINITFISILRLRFPNN